MSDELTNPALSELSFLVGDWEMTISEASFLPAPDQVLTGSMVVVPIETGKLLAMRQAGEPGGPPVASWVVGRDASGPGYTVLYTDARPVSRVYEMSLTDDRWMMWRNDPDFSQRFSASISDDHQTLDGRWEKRPSSGEWEHDFRVVYSRR